MEERSLQEKRIAIVRSLYTDVFESGDCQAVDQYYHPEAISHFSNRTLSLAEMKAAMRTCVAQSGQINTTILSVFASGDRTYARLRREISAPGQAERRSVHIMVEKRFVGEKVCEVWFLVDDAQYASPWGEPYRAA